MNHRMYNLTKALNRIIFPALGTAYYTISRFLDLPNENTVLALFIILSAFTGVILQFTSKIYEPKVLFQGEIVISEGKEGKKLFSLELSANPDEITKMEAITFKVVPPQNEHRL